jgi:hypothetical protein
MEPGQFPKIIILGSLQIHLRKDMLLNLQQVEEL